MSAYINQLIMDLLSEHLKSEYLILRLGEILEPENIIRRNEEAVKKEVETNKSES